MYIKDYMSSDLITISPSTSLGRADEMMRAHDINRLPVVDNGKYVGLVTREILTKSLPSDASSLDRREVNYILQKATAADVMARHVPTVTPDTLLDEAAATMAHKNIGAMVVMEGEDLVGIITDKDIFKAFIDISGYYSPGTSLVVELAEDRPGVFEEIGDALVETEHNLTHMIVYHINGAIRIVMHIESEQVDNLVQAIQGRGYDVKTIVNRGQ